MENSYERPAHLLEPFSKYFEWAAYFGFPLTLKTDSEAPNDMNTEGDRTNTKAKTSHLPFWAYAKSTITDEGAKPDTIGSLCGQKYPRPVPEAKNIRKRPNAFWKLAAYVVVGGYLSIMPIVKLGNMIGIDTFALYFKLMESGMSLLDVLSGNVLLQPPTMFLIIAGVMLVRKLPNMQCFIDEVEGLRTALPLSLG